MGNERSGPTTPRPAKIPGQGKVRSKPLPFGSTFDSIDQPVSAVHWVKRELLRSNQYNPNRVAKPELELLAVSIREDGWTQPIVVRHHPTEKGCFEVVDGFHRYLVSGYDDIWQMTGGEVPIVIINKGSLADQMMSTIRHNRARGVHGVRPMSEIIVELVDKFHLSEAEICLRLGMEDEEVERLYDHSGMPGKVAREKDDFSKGWKPTREEAAAAGRRPDDGTEPKGAGQPVSRRSV